MFLGEQGKSVTGWIPVMTPYAGNGYGAYALPEVGQVVVLAFEMGDRNCPIVIGTMWDKKNVQPENTTNKENTVKRFKTKAGSEIVFSDEKNKESITISTPQNLTVFLDDEKKHITLKDKAGDNQLDIDTDKGEVTISVKQKLHIKVGGDEVISIDKQSVSVKTQDIKNEAKGTFSADGQNVKLTAKANVNIEGKAGVEAKANGSMKLNSSGMLEVKGSMLKLN